MTARIAVLGCALLTLAAAPSALPLARSAGAQAPTGTASYSCPMHPDVTADAPGACPRCGMALVRMDPFDAREYEVDVDTFPAAVPAGGSVGLRLTVREPRTHCVVREFATVHDKRYHLFVISADL